MADNEHRSVLLIEADHATILRIRRLINTNVFETKNMIWKQGRPSPWDAGFTYEQLNDVLVRVMRKAREMSGR